jgi:hypothetical protein
MVGGSTGIRTQDQRIKKAPRGSGTPENSANRGERPDVLGPPKPPIGQSVGNQDPLEETIVLAARAGQWAVVERLAAELEARRHARAGVVSIDAERARRDRSSGP